MQHEITEAIHNEAVYNMLLAHPEHTDSVVDDVIHALIQHEVDLIMKPIIEEAFRFLVEDCDVDVHEGKGVLRLHDAVRLNIRDYQWTAPE